MTKNYSYQTNYIAQYVLKYININVKATSSGLEGASCRKTWRMSMPTGYTQKRDYLKYAIAVG